MPFFMPASPQGEALIVVGASPENDHLSLSIIYLQKCFLSLYYENSPLLLGTLMLSSKCWLRPDDISMPLAQLREKAVCAVHHPPLLGYRVK